MKIITFSAALLLGIFSLSLHAQSSEKSSGVVQLNMKKKQETTAPTQKNVSSTTFTPTIKKASDLPKAEPGSAPDVEARVQWISPALSTISTAGNTYDISAVVTSPENLRVVNIFLNDKYYKNLVVGPGEENKINVKSTIDLTLGNNVIKVQGVTTGGKRIEDQIFINYDISSARYYAVIIAVEEYRDPMITDLSQPISDANNFYRVISSNYTFNQEDITFLKNPTKADIIGTLHHLRNVVTSEDNLLIYFAGHGYWDEEMMTGYWLPSDAERNNPVNWLPNTDLTNYLNALKTKHTLLIADACFSGGIFKTRAAFNPSASIEKLYRLTSRKAMTSGNLNEVPDKSVFIEYLIKRLKENNEEYWTSEQLFSSMRTAVMNNSNNVPMYGTIQNVGDEGGDFVFIHRK